MSNCNVQAGSTQATASAAVLQARACAPAILLVEDDKILRRYLEVLLRRAGYTVVAAADGLEAIRVAFSSDVAAVVTDAVMPRLGGHELCRIIRSDKDRAHLPLVMLTGVAHDGSHDDFAHADARLTKPVRADELLFCLKRLINRTD
ncbi:MAG: response regulator [Acidobacteria bacterium]|nr:response regulator [Acidobacteriota bacterium]